MDQSWMNYGNTSYLQSVCAADNTNLNLVSDGRSFKPRAYINPKLVNCTYPFSNVYNAPVSNKIHINPNFKRPYYQTASAQPKNDMCSVHVNPYFCHTKSNFKKNSEQVDDKLALNTLLNDEGDNGRKSIQVPVMCGQGLLQKESPTSYESRKFQLSTNTTNSAYFWSKHGATPETVSMSHSKSETGSYKTVVTTKYVPLTSTNIKTRHKIVHKLSSPSNVHKINRIMNCKLHFQNPYKIFNAEKSKLDGSQKSKLHCSLKKRNFSIYSKINVVNVNKGGDLVDSKRIAGETKMNISNISQASYVNRLTNLIRTKYIHQNKRIQQKLLSIGNYKLDKRKKNASLKRDANVKDARGSTTSFSKDRCTPKDKTWKSVLWKPSRFKRNNHLVWRKQGTLEEDLQRIGKSYPNKTVVNIGGIMYKSTVNKLTRTKDKKQSSHQFNSGPVMTPRKILQIVYVRGEKFLIGESGKTLIRQINSDNTVGNVKYSVKRVDIGGVTYIQKSNNVLIQTKTHQARHFVNYAKQKSIALLSNLHKRNNKPCMIYQKFGICRRHTKGMCIYIHDRKNVALCKKFLKGECTGSHCLLSHDIVKEKVATCHFFLKGNCHRDNCPFLHVKVNSKAAICTDFLHGFCSLGQNCTKRHIHQCPDFDEKESCSRGVKCPYPHRKVTQKKMKNGKTYRISKFKLTKNRGNKADKEKTDVKIKKKEKKKPKTIKRKIKKEKCSSQDGGNDSIIECIPKRIKLDDLPLFIPLNI